MKFAEARSFQACALPRPMLSALVAASLLVPAASVAAAPTTDEVLVRTEKLLNEGALEDAIRTIESGLAHAESDPERARLWYAEAIVRLALSQPVTAFEFLVRAYSVDDRVIFTQPWATGSPLVIAECACWFVRGGHAPSEIRPLLAKSVGAAPTEPDLNGQIQTALEVEQSWRCPVKRIDAARDTPPPAPPLVVAAPPKLEEEGGSSVWIWVATGAVVVGGAIALGVAASTESGPDGGSTGFVLRPLGRE